MKKYVLCTVLIIVGLATNSNGMDQKQQRFNLWQKVQLNIPRVDYVEMSKPKAYDEPDSIDLDGFSLIENGFWARGPKAIAAKQKDDMESFEKELDDLQAKRNRDSAALIVEESKESSERDDLKISSLESNFAEYHRIERDIIIMRNFIEKMNDLAMVEAERAQERIKKSKAAWQANEVQRNAIETAARKQEKRFERIAGNSYFGTE